MLYDADADRIYLNIKPKDELVVIDPNSNSIVAHWPTSPADAPHGLAFDPVTGRLFSAGMNGQLAVLDAKTGKLIASAPIAGKVDQIAFDPATRRIYCACADWMSVVQETDQGVVFLGNVRTAATAKNVAVDPQTHEVWTTYTDGTNSYAKAWRP
jgi:DNA-binding beta-propeller fold protein YncE